MAGPGVHRAVRPHRAPVWRLLEGLQLAPFVPASAAPEQTRILVWASSSLTVTEKRKEKGAVGGEATGGVLSSPPAGRAAPASPAHLRAEGFLGMGLGDDAGLRSRRCAAGREGRALGREEKVHLSLEGIFLTIFSPLPRECRCFPTPLSRLCGPVPPAQPQHSPHGTGRLDSAPLGVALGQRKELGKICRIKSLGQGASPGKSFLK